MIKALITIFILSSVLSVFGQAFTLSGSVNGFEKDPIVGATVYIKENGLGTTTDEDGRFSLELGKGVYTLQVRFVGRENLEKKVPVFKNVNMYIRLRLEAIVLEEVVKSARPEDYRNEQPRSRS